MKLIDDLRLEHETIEQVVGSLRTFAARRVDASAAAADAEAYLRFFRHFAGRYHHAREEEVLFPALVRDAELPGDRGPLLVLREDHRAMARLLDELAVAGDEAAAATDPRAGARRFAELAERFGRALLHHIDAENSVFLPEAEARLRRAGVRELPDRLPDVEEAAAQEEVGRLLELHPPSEIPGLVRGDGCVGCEAFGVRCDGIEREWWTELEWEEFHQRGE